MVCVRLFTMAGRLLVTAEVSSWAYISELDRMLQDRGYYGSHVSYVSLSDWVYYVSSYHNDRHIWYWYPEASEDFQVVFHCTDHELYELPVTLVLEEFGHRREVHTYTAPKSRVGILNRAVADVQFRYACLQCYLVYRREHEGRSLSSTDVNGYLDQYAGAHGVLSIPRVHVWRIEVHRTSRL